MKYSFFALMAALAVTCAHAAATTVTTDFSLDGPMSFKAAAGDTVTYSGKITGTGPVIIEAGSPETTVGGTVVFTNPENSYTGGTLISNAYFRVDDANAAGTGAVNIRLGRQQINGKGTYYNRSRFTINCSSFTNSIVQNGRSYDSETDISLQLAASATLTGPISSSAEFHIINLGTASASSVWGDIYAPNQILGILAKGKNFDVYGKLTGNPFYPRSSSSDKIVGIRTNGHTVASIKVVSSTYLGLYATNAFTGAVVQCWDGVSSSSSYDTRALIYLNGYPQKFLALAKGDEKAIYNAVNRSSGALSLVTPADKPTTVTLTGTSPKSLTTCMSQFGFRGPVSLVVDAESSNFCQCFYNRDVQTSGDLTVKRGKMTTEGYGAFPNVPNLSVEAEGELTVAYTNADCVIFASLTNLSVYGKLTVTSPRAFTTTNIVLTVGPDAVFTLPAKADPYAFKAIYTADAEGKLTRLYGVLQLTQLPGVSVSASVEKTPVTWTGGASTASVGESGNWSNAEVPSLLAAGGLLATFASGGSEADVDRALYLDSLAFAPAEGTAGFTLKGTGSILTCQPGISVAAATDGAARTYAVQVPLVQQGDLAGAFDVPDGTTLSLEGGYTHQYAVTDVRSGGGSLKFSGTSSFGGSLSLPTGTNTFAGTVTTASGILFPTKLVDAGGGLTRPSNFIRLDNATINGSFTFDGPADENDSGILDKGNWFVVSGDNVINGAFTFTRLDSTRNTHGANICGPGGATLTLAGGGTIGSASTISPRLTFSRTGGTEDFRVTIPAGSVFSELCHGSGMVAYGNTVLRIESSGNGSARPSSRYNGVSVSGGKIELAVDNALAENTQFWFFSGGSGTFDLLGTKQRILRVTGNNDDSFFRNTRKNSHITGTSGSELALREGLSQYNFEGGLSLRKWGEEGTTLVHSNNVAKSCGDIVVEGGTLRFGEKGFWPVGTNVTVEAAGVLSLAESGTFGRHVNLAVAEGGKVQLDTGVVQRVRTLTLGGVRREGGTWGSSQSAAAHKDDTYFTGTGVVRVRGGLVIYLR